MNDLLRLLLILTTITASLVADPTVKLIDSDVFEETTTDLVFKKKNYLGHYPIKEDIYLVYSKETGSSVYLIIEEEGLTYLDTATVDDNQAREAFNRIASRVLKDVIVGGGEEDLLKQPAFHNFLISLLIGGEALFVTPVSKYEEACDSFPFLERDGNPEVFDKLVKLSDFPKISVLKPKWNFSYSLLTQDLKLFSVDLQIEVDEETKDVRLKSFWIDYIAKVTHASRN